MDNNTKLVRFDIYCKSCVNKETPEYEDPCNQCLIYGGRANSEKPEYYKEAYKRESNKERRQ